MDSSTGKDEELSPVDLFALLANDTRMAAMQALWTADQPLAFSELARRADIEDTGNFTYHLEKLKPNFVRKVEDKYRLTRAGQRVLTAVLAGRFTEHPSLDRIVVEYDCPFCGEPIVLERGSDALRVSCTACPGIYRDYRGDERITKVWLPPAGVRDQPTATLDAALQWTFTRNWAFARGVCPECAGAVDASAKACVDHDTGDGLCDVCGGRYAVLARYQCRTCHESVSIIALFAMLADKEVRSFFSDHGHDPTQFTFHSLTSAIPYQETVVDRDPLRYELRLEQGGECLVITGNERLEIDSIERAEL